MMIRLFALPLMVGVAFALQGCSILGCDSASSTDFATANFQPTSTVASRTASQCGVAPATYAADDHLTLTMTDSEGAPPFTTMTIELAASTPVEEEIPLSVTPAANAGDEDTAADAQSLVHLSFARGSDPNAVDATALNAVTVTVQSMPTADQQPLTVSVHAFFLDGSDLQATFESSTTTTPTLCLNTLEARTLRE